jgi:tetratricopeptide (TPR) repeat protein
MHMRRMLMLRAIVAATFVVGAAAGAQAQTGRAFGIVKDDQGAAVKGATVTATPDNPETKPASIVTTTDDKGRFAMIGMPSGLWNFMAQAPGYRPQIGAAQIRQGMGNPPPLAFTLQRDVAPPSVLGVVAAKDLQTLLAAADDLFNSQRWDEAIASYKSILAQAPALSVINLQIAGAFRNKKDYEAALGAYNDLLKADAANEKAKIGIAMTNLEKGDLPAAERTLEAAAAGSEATREVFYDLGEVKLSKGQIEDALKAYQRATQVDPAWGKPLLAIGRIHANAGDAAAAAKDFQRVLDVDPASAEAAQARAALNQLKQ